MVHPIARSLIGILFILLVALFRTTDAATTPWRDAFPDATVVRELANLSRLMFDIASVDDPNIPDGMEPKLFVETDRGTEALVGALQIEGGDEIIFVAFRGTEEDSDWKTNRQIALRHFGTHDRPLPSSDSPVRVHSGFNDACLTGNIYQQINDTVAHLLEDRDSLANSGVDPPTVYVTGYSLGGVDALVMGSYLAYTTPELNFQMISFGAPQLGNAAFKSWVEDELENLSVWRFVNNNDIVPRVLPLLPHVGHLMWMVEGGIRAYWRQDGGGDFVAPPSSWGFGLSISDHEMTSYIDYLELCVEHPDLYYPTDFTQTCTKSFWEFWRSC